MSDKVKVGSNAKKYLSRPYYIKQKIEDKEAEIENLRGMLGNKAVQLKTDKVKSSNIGGAEPDIIASICDIEKEIDELYSKYNEIMLENKKVIESIPDPMQERVMHRYFIAMNTIGEIADEFGYSVRHTYRLYSDALEYIELNLLTDIES